ncbi:hypothetical protein OG216_10765 [Streptomycetaceae bacterium NBC_01309]
MIRLRHHHKDPAGEVAETRADVAGSGYPGSTPAEKYAAARDERRHATDGSAALDRAVGRDDAEATDDSGPKAPDPQHPDTFDTSDTDISNATTTDTETRELLTDEPPPNRRPAP